MSGPGVGLIASAEELEQFARGGPGQQLTPPVRGALAEVAATGLVRYPWRLLRPVIESLLEDDLVEFEAASQVEVGPARPLPGGETPAELRKRLKAALQEFDSEAPFTLQRLCELLLEPSKQYTRLDKLAVALEKLLMVTSTVATAASPPARPALASLPPINENPSPPATAPAAAVRPPQMGALPNGVASHVFGGMFSHAAESAGAAPVHPSGGPQSTAEAPATAEGGRGPQAPAAVGTEPQLPPAGSADPSRRADAQAEVDSRQQSAVAGAGPQRDSSTAGQQGSSGGWPVSHPGVSFGPAVMLEHPAAVASAPCVALPPGTDAAPLAGPPTVSQFGPAAVAGGHAAAAETSSGGPAVDAAATGGAAGGGSAAAEGGERGGSVPLTEAAAGVPDADGRPRERDSGSGSRDEGEAQPPAKRPALEVDPPVGSGSAPAEGASSQGTQGEDAPSPMAVD